MTNEELSRPLRGIMYKPLRGLGNVHLNEYLTAQNLFESTRSVALAIR